MDIIEEIMGFLVRCVTRVFYYIGIFIGSAVQELFHKGLIRANIRGVPKKTEKDSQEKSEEQRLAGRGTDSWSAGLARWRCREPSRQLYIGARVLRVLSLEPLHPLQLRDAHPAVLRLPVEVGHTADPMLRGQLAECDSGFAFLQDRNNL